MTKAEIIEFQKNRPHFPNEELLKYNGNWVAFSADGKRIVACGKTLDDLVESVKAIGGDMQNVGMERVEYEPFVVHIGAAEFQ
jgi:hypothetical protein